MFRDKIPNPRKALRLEKKGDRLHAKGKLDKALQFYEKSEKYDPERPEIYKKLIQTLEELDQEWSQEDFDRSMTWTMRQQELEHPEIKQVHEKFTDEYHAVQKLVQKLMIIPGPEEEVKIISEIISYGEKAHLPVLDFILSIKKVAQAPVGENEPEL